MGHKLILRLGYWSATAMALAAAGYGLAQIGQVLRWLTFPLDELLIFGFSICIATPYLVAMLVVNHLTRPEDRFWSSSAVVFAAMYTVLVSTIYLIELAVKIPGILHGTILSSDPLNVSGHNPLWAADALGYAFMSISALFAAPLFGRPSQRALFWWLIAHGVQAPLILVILWYPQLLLAGSPWIVTGPAVGYLLARHLKSFTQGKP